MVVKTEHLSLVELLDCLRLLVMNHVGHEGAGQLEVKVGDLFKDRDEVRMLDVLLVGEATVDDSLLVEEVGAKA